MATIIDQETGRPLQVPRDPGVFWGRLKLGRREWLKLRVVWHSEGQDRPRVLSVQLPGEFRAVRDFEWELDWPLEGASPAILEPSPPVVEQRKAERFGGYSSPAKVGDVSYGGLTIWDEYVLAIAPEIFKCAPDNAHQHEIAAGIATMADAMLAERKKRENDDAR